MNPVGQKVADAVTGLFPGVEMSFHERDYGNVLSCSYSHENKRFAIQTPETRDYRQQDAVVWIHRFSELLKQRVRP